MNVKNKMYSLYRICFCDILADCPNGGWARAESSMNCQTHAENASKSQALIAFGAV